MQSQSGSNITFEQVLVILLFIWKERNNSVFKSKRSDPETLIESANRLLFNFIKWGPQSSKLYTKLKDLQLSWLPPVDRELKINTDNSVVAEESVAFVTDALRDASGTLLDGFDLKIPVSLTIQVEANTIVETVRQFVLRRENANRV